jgi:hypothetical protein
LTGKEDFEENNTIPSGRTIMGEESVQESRRRLLKIIVATGGAAAVSTVLPGTWLKPVIETGVLPAHAALSDFGVDITNLLISDAGAGSQDAGAAAYDRSATYDWEALCAPNDGDFFLHVSSDLCNPTPIHDWIPTKLPMKKKKDPSDPYQGRGDFDFDSCFTNSSSDRLYVKLKGPCGTSNTLSGMFYINSTIP